MLYSNETARWTVLITILLFTTTPGASSPADQNVSSNDNMTMTPKSNVDEKSSQYLRAGNTTIDSLDYPLIRRQQTRDPLWNLNYHGYQDKKSLPNKWTEWLKQWKQKIKAKKENYTDDMNDGRHPYWVGMPEEGVDPPPWAIMPVSNKKNDSWTLYGRPRYCFLSSSRGNCSRTLNRWAFIPHKNGCEPFIYSGCGQNANNFLHKKLCMDLCGSTPSSCCGGFYEETSKKYN